MLLAAVLGQQQIIIAIDVEVHVVRADYSGMLPNLSTAHNFNAHVLEI